MRILILKIPKLLVGIILSLAFPIIGMPDENDLTKQCVDSQSESQLQLCVKAANSINSNERLLQKLGKQLESKMHYQSAVSVYEIGSQKNSHSKLLLQSLIRARAAWRKQKNSNKAYLQQTVIASNDHVPITDAKDCYELRYQQALKACRAAIVQTPQDSALHERLGDVFKSMGRKKAAAKSYQESLNINNENESLKQKLTALMTITSENLSSHTETNHVNKASDSTLVGQSSTELKSKLKPRAYSVAVKQIALLDRLLKQKIISQEDYDHEMQLVLSQAESINNSQNALITNADKRAPKKLHSIGDGNYHALIIGNNDYKSNDYPDLVTAVNDAKKIDSILKKQYGFKTRLLLDADRYSIMNAVSSLRKTLKPRDKLLIYYAGHGILDETTSQGYWLPVDAEPESIANWVSANDITDALTGISAQHALVIADSCFSASLIRGVNSARLDEQDALLIRLNSKRSRTVLTSGGLEPVQDDGGGQHSVFANALISLLEDNEGLLEAGKLFIQLRNKVILNADQTPQYAPILKAGHDGGDFIFIPT